MQCFDARPSFAGEGFPFTGFKQKGGDASIFRLFVPNFPKKQQEKHLQGLIYEPCGAD